MSAALTVTENDRIAMGGNNPPAFDAHKANVDDLRSEASTWLDGAQVATPEEAEGIDTLIKLARSARDEADKQRAAEKKPHDDAAKAVQAQWKPLVDSAQRILDVCLEKVGSWRVAEANRKEAVAAVLRAEAEAERQAEVEATRGASGNIDAREQADQLAVSAKTAEKLAAKAEKAVGKGNGLVPYRTLKVTDTRALAGWLWKHRREQVEEAHEQIAQGILRARTRGYGLAEMDGTEIITEMKAR
ncbi:MAG: hypothetical protein ACOH2M_03380 [Cypionkella sp.]